MWGKILALTWVACFVAACTNDDADKISQLAKSDNQPNSYALSGFQAISAGEDEQEASVQYFSDSVTLAREALDGTSVSQISSDNAALAQGGPDSTALSQPSSDGDSSSLTQSSDSAISMGQSETSLFAEAVVTEPASQLSETGSAVSVVSAPDPGVLAAVNIAVALITENVAPKITVLGESALAVVQGSVYTDAGATVADDFDQSLTINTTGEVDTSVLGEYTINYSATDSSGYSAAATRTVNVIAAPATLARAHRLLLQTTFGPRQDELDYVQLVGTTAWIDEQLAKPSAYDDDRDATKHRTHLERTIEIAKHAQPTVNWDDNGTKPFNQPEASFSADDYQMAAWWENAIGLHPTNTLHGSDQLRQRVAYALSQLLVTSTYEAPLFRRGEALAAYYDILAKHAFGNYRDLLGEVARSPAMGVYLSHQGNRKADVAAGTRPDENFAREVMQLFTIGLYQLNIDGTPDRDNNPATLSDAGDNLVPSYTQGDIEELAKVMTGWDLVDNPSYGKNNNKHGDYTKPMEFTASEHEQGNVTVLGQVIDLASGADNSGMDAALDVLFNHQNAGPYVSKHLIMRLVTSNPSAAYINRVAAVFNDDGNGVRGNLKAVVRAILVDYEARGDAYVTQDGFGKFKEPLLAWTQLLRATDAVPLDGWQGKDYSRDGGTLVNGVYWFSNPQSYFGQGAMRSPSVFNFYNADYVPSDNAFAANGLVGPEMQIQTDQVLLEYNNKLVSQLTYFEKNKITIQDGATLEEFAATKSFSSAPVMLVSLDRALQVFKAALADNYDNIENTAPDGVAFREKAAVALIQYLDQLLLGETMTTEYKAALREFLLNASGLKDSDNFIEALNMVRNATRMVAASALYMVQK